MTHAYPEAFPDNPQQAHAGGAPLQTQDASSRIFSIDVLRGIAVLGALFVSVWRFGGFGNNQQNRLLILSKGANYRLFGMVSLLVEGKMQALISLVFGAAMILFLSGSQKEKLPAADIFIRRQLWLVAFGLVNALLFLWTGDVLFHLGIMGILLFPFVRLSARGLLIAAVITTLICSAKNYWSYADTRSAYRKYLAVTALEKKLAANKLIRKDSLNTEQKNDKKAWEGMAANQKVDPKKEAAERKEMRPEQYGKLWSQVLPAVQERESQWTYKYGIWNFSGMILLGMALFKTGFFNRRFQPRQYLLVALGGLTAGMLLAWFRLYHHQAALHNFIYYVTRNQLPYELFFPFESAFMALGYAGAVMFLLEMRFLRFLWRALAAAGRMSLTNYLLQSMVCTLFFTGFGMGYYGRLQQYQLYVLAAEVCLVQTVFSIVWLRHFREGPAEWLWRYLSHGKWEPKKVAVQTSMPAFS